MNFCLLARHNQLLQNTRAMKDFRMELITLRIVALGICAFVLTLATLPSIVYFLLPQSEFDLTQLGNSSCDTTIPVNVSALLETFNIRSTGIGAFLSVSALVASIGEKIELSPFALRKAMRILNITEWPPSENVSLSNSQLFALVTLVTSPLTLDKHELTCNKDLSLDGDKQCCFLSCPDWNFITGARETIADAVFGVELILGVVAIIVASIAMLSMKTERKFPHVVVAWYLAVSCVIPTLVEAVGRLVGQRNSVCCGKTDILQASAAGSENCPYTIICAAVHTFMFRSVSLWLCAGFFNVWLAIVRSRGDLFVDYKNTIHAIEGAIVWGIAALSALIPYGIRGTKGYQNVLLCFMCPSVDTSIEYFSITVIDQVAGMTTGFFAIHLLYTLKKKSIERKRLLAEGGRAMQKSGGRSLQMIERRFLIHLTVMLITAIIFILDYFIVSYVTTSIDVEKIVRDYISCVFLYPNRSCSRGETLQNWQFVYLLMFRIGVIATIISHMVFFYTAKDFRVFCKNVFVRCCSRKRNKAATSSGKPEGDTAAQNVKRTRAD
ncbi:uncharacterized protein [Oscarella lobularis]|uniref:uncharacterized protein isoform X2 n=1 Tax=Oscarella lobularis TaxID=121494 RepID=UPI0033143CEF